MNILKKLISFGLGFALSISSVFAGGEDAGFFPLHFTANGFCGIWDIAPIDFVGQPVDKTACTAHSIGGRKGFYGDCKAKIQKGNYQLYIAAMHNDVQLNVDASGVVSVLPPYASDGLIAKGGAGKLELVLADIEFVRNGFAGLIYFTHIEHKRVFAECEGKETLLPAGAQWPLGLGSSLHSWVVFDPFGQVHVDAQYGVYRDRQNPDNQLRLILDPVPIRITPLGQSTTTPWRIQSVSDEFAVGAQVVLLIPGTKYVFTTKLNVQEHLSVPFNFASPCKVAPNVLPDKDTDAAGFLLEPMCNLKLNHKVDFSNNADIELGYPWVGDKP